MKKQNIHNKGQRSHKYKLAQQTHENLNSFIISVLLINADAHAAVKLGCSTVIAVNESTNYSFLWHHFL